MEKLISIIKNGKFTGTQYTQGQFDKSVEDFHKGQGESWVLNERFNIEIQEPTDEETDFQEPDYGSPTQEQLDEIVAREAKVEKTEALANIVVTTSNGNTFDGNESARLNMSNAIQASEILGLTSSNWKLANNEVKEITIDELKEALALSIQAVGNIIIGA